MECWSRRARTQPWKINTRINTRSLYGIYFATALLFLSLYCSCTIEELFPVQILQCHSFKHVNKKSKILNYEVKVIVIRKVIKNYSVGKGKSFGACSCIMKLKKSTTATTFTSILFLLLKMCSLLYMAQYFSDFSHSTTPHCLPLEQKFLSGMQLPRD